MHSGTRSDVTAATASPSELRAQAKAPTPELARTHVPGALEADAEAERVGVADGLSDQGVPGHKVAIRGVSTRTAPIRGSTACLRRVHGHIIRIGREALRRPLLSSWPNAAVGAYMALAPMCIGYVLFGWGLAHVPASTATTLSLLEPAVAAVLAVLVVGERLPLLGWGASPWSSAASPCSPCRHGQLRGPER